MPAVMKYPFGGGGMGLVFTFTYSRGTPTNQNTSTLRKGSSRAANVKVEKCLCLITAFTRLQAECFQTCGYFPQFPRG